MDNTDRTVTINILDWLEEETKQELRKEERADYLKLKTRMVKLKTDAILEMYNCIFSEKERKAIAKLNLQFNDFKKVVEAAINLIVNEDGEDDQGE